MLFLKDWASVVGATYDQDSDDRLLGSMLGSPAHVWIHKAFFSILKLPMI